MTKAETAPKTIEHKEGEATSLPSMHVDHAAVFANEMAVRLAGFDTGIAAIVADMDGMQKQFEEDQAERAAEHAAAMEKRHLLKRNLERGRRMALAASEVYGQDIPADIDTPEEKET